MEVIRNSFVLFFVCFGGWQAKAYCYTVKQRSDYRYAVTKRCHSYPPREKMDLVY